MVPALGLYTGARPGSLAGRRARSRHHHRQPGERFPPRHGDGLRRGLRRGLARFRRLQGHRAQGRIPHHDPLQREGGESGGGAGGFHAQRRRRAGDHHGGRHGAAARAGGRFHRGARVPRRHPAPSPEWPRGSGFARTLSRHQCHPRHAWGIGAIHGQRAAPQRQLLHGRRRQCQYRRHRRRIARPGDGRRTARLERLR